LSILPASAFAEDGAGEDLVTEEQEPETEKHEHEYVPKVTAPTCTEQGYTTWTCACGDSYTGDYVDALGHTPVEAEEIPAEVGKPGRTAGVVCAVCGEVLEGCETIPPLDVQEPETGDPEPHEHVYVPTVTEPTCTEQGYTTWACACGDGYTGDYVDALGHTPVEAEEIPAEEGKPGRTAGKICAVCGEVLEGCEPIPALEEETVITIAEQPEDAAPADGAVTFTVSAAVSTDAELSYQWQRLDESVEYKDEEEREAAWEDLNDEAGDTLRLEGLDDGDLLAEVMKYAYRCALKADGTAISTEEVHVQPAREMSVRALAKSASASGECGIGATWELDEGTLIISGNSYMYDYDYSYVIGEFSPWYSDSDEIKRVVIKNILNIGNYAFSNCKNLTEVEIWSSVLSIGDHAFEGCLSLESVTIPDSVLSIGDYAFQGCESLGLVTMSDGLTSIGDSAFSDCSNLTSITIPGSVTSIGSYAFQNCSNLTSMTIPDSVLSIGDYAFKACWYLESVDFGSGVQSIGDHAFYNCSSLESVDLPDSVTSLGSYAFQDCGIETATIGSGVTSIGDSVFSDCRCLNSVTIPDSVTGIGPATFQNCTNLNTLTIPDSVTNIGNATFSGTGLKTVFLEGDMPDIGVNAFQNVNAYIVYPSGNPTYTEEKIQNYGGELTWTTPATIVFDANGGTGGPDPIICISGEFTAIPDEEPEREYHTFLGWARTKSAAESDVRFGDSFRPSGEVVLYAVWEKNAINMGLTDDGIKWIMYADGELVLSPAVYGDTARIVCEPWSEFIGMISTVTIEDGVTEIGDNVFLAYPVLRKVSIPDSVRHIGSGAFAGCTGLTDIQIPDGTSVDGGALDGVPLAPVTFALDHEYLLLKEDEAAQIKLIDLEEDLEPLVAWYVEDEDSERDDSSAVLECQGNGWFGAKDCGTAYAVASLTVDGRTFTARCRVDVVENTSDDMPIEVRLPSTKATVELYKTEYTRIQVIPELEQNLHKKEILAAGRPTIVLPEEEESDEGLAIKSAKFVEGKVDEIFRLRVVDDRTLEIIPRSEYITTDAAVLKDLEKTYTSKIELELQSWGNVHDPSFTNKELTITLKRTLPKLAAKAVKLNSFYTSSKDIVFTGSTPEEVRVDESRVTEILDDGYFLADGDLYTDGKTVTYWGGYGEKGKGTVYLLAKVEGWAVELPVTVSVSWSQTLPKLTLKKKTVSIQAGAGDSAEAAFTITPSVFADVNNFYVKVLSIYEGKTQVPIEDGPLSVETHGSSVVVRQGGYAEPNDETHTYKVNLCIDDKTYPVYERKLATLTVKVLGVSAPPVLTVKTSGTIDLAVKGSPMKFIPTLKNVGSQAYYEITGITNADGLDREAFFYVDGLTLATYEDLEPGKYIATVTATYGNTGSVSKNVAFTVKRSAMTPASSVALKTAGSIDVVKHGSYITVTPVIKNCYTHLLKESDLVFCYGTGKKAVPITNGEYCPFQVEMVGNQFRISLKSDTTVNHLTEKYSVYMKLDNGKVSAKKALSVKSSAAKVKQSVKTVTLLKTDRYSRGTVVLSVTTPNLSGIDWTKTTQAFISPKDKSGKPFFTLQVLGSDTCAICYTGNEINPAVKAGTVKIPIFLDGNVSSKANATVSVKVKLQ
nr:leucine-rich repeat protein [Clostridiales bacterium]